MVSVSKDEGAGHDAEGEKANKGEGKRNGATKQSERSGQGSSGRDDCGDYAKRGYYWIGFHVFPFM